MKIMTWMLAAVWCFTSTVAGAAQIGKPLITIDKQAVKIEVIRSGAILEIRPVSDTIVRVTCRPKGAPERKPSLIVNNPLDPFTGWDCSESADVLEIRTAKLIVEYSKGDDAIRFLRKDTGELILGEKPGDGRSFVDTAVEQTFLCGADEVLGGLGQQTDGAMNFRGRFAHLCQYNIIKAIPVLVSSRGYGILWDNCSLTEVNRRKSPVPLEFHPYTKTWGGTFTPRETGQHVFVLEKLNRNIPMTTEKVSVRVDGKEIIARECPWHPNYYSGTVVLEKDRPCKIMATGSIRLFYQPPSLTETTSIWSEVGEGIDYYFMYGPQLDGVIAGYRNLTGAAPLFPKWAYGFWQSRERYTTGEELVAIVDEYRKRNHPLDVIVQDWQYWRDYGWNALKVHPDYARDMKAIVGRLHDRHARVLFSVWPNFGSEPANEAHAEFKEKGYLLDDSVLGDYIGNYQAALQGMQKNFSDFFKPGVGDAFWKRMKQGLFDAGIDGWWLDANEPNLASIQGVFHLYQTAAGPAAAVLNAYPLVQTRSIYENQRKETSAKRVCLLSRSGFAGQQRYAAAVWSGDTYGSWAVLKWNIAGGINYCLSGLPYWGTDIGGFFGGDPDSPAFRELYARWFQYGAFCPIFRAHGTGSKREVWQFGPESEAIQHKYLVLRYRLMPYIYSVAWKVTRDHSTMLRGLVLDFPRDAKACTVADQFMFGPALLVCPVTEPGARERPVYLPAGTGWYDFWTGAYHQGGTTLTAKAPLDQIPLFVRAGSIVVMGPEMQYTSEKQADPLEVRVYAGQDAAFTVYEDEGDNYGYEQGIYAEIPIQWRQGDKTLTLGGRTGRFPGMLERRTIKVKWIGVPGKDSGTCVDVAYTGEGVCVKGE
jgi:alpha-D-xyloside xylohydrolase